LNIGGGMENSMSLLELLFFLEKRLEIKLIYAHLPWRASDQKFFVADNSKAARLLHWSPQMAKEQGIEDTLAWESR
jgi:CDP-paratose 2-epimerase